LEIGGGCGYQINLKEGKMKFCDYGCGQKAIYKFKNDKWCCSKSHNSCVVMKDKNSNKNLGRGLGRKLTKKTKNKMSESRKGIQAGIRNPSWKGGYNSKNIPRYDVYEKQLIPIEETRRNSYDKNILEVKCAYCGKWYIPKLHTVIDRIRSINSTTFGDHRFYCLDMCKQECSIYGQHKYPKGFKPATSREVQPELRQMRFEIDNYTCQKCKKHQDELEVALHCHHIEGILWEPLESADVDKVITYCKICHKEVHEIEGCGYNDMKCK